MTRLCVPIMVEEIHAALADAQAARDGGADLVEFRIDGFFSGAGGAEEVAAVVRLVSDSPLPCIVTCRPSAGDEGGFYDGDETERIALFERLGTAQPPEHPPRYIDVELASYTRSANLRQKVNLAVDHPAQARDLRTSLILSTHDFAARPPDLTRRLLRMRQEPAAAVLKIAFRARSLRDNLELFDLLAEADRPMIALGMGEFGMMSRVLAPKFGGFVTFAALRPAAATAPGQPTLRDLLDLYRFRSINPGTRVYGVVGWPIAHSASPHLHNAGFEAASFDAVYLPLPVPPEYEHFKATLGSLIDHPRLDFGGCSVTLPHKEHLVRFARERTAAGDGRWSIDPISDACGAANTLVLERGSAPEGNGSAMRTARVLNTDAPAAVACLRGALGDLSGRRTAVVGAGGVARSVAAGLASAGANVVVCNRSRPRAEALARDLRTFAAGSAGRGTIGAADLDALDALNCDALINCTPVGMAGGPDPAGAPVSLAAIGHAGRPGGPIVFDTVYTPRRTPLLIQADAAGLTTIDGLSMFVRQAAEQFTAWTGRPAPLGLFERIAQEASAPEPSAPPSPADDHP